jgi:chemotaxis protein methyltransferase CheR
VGAGQAGVRVSTAASTREVDRFGDLVARDLGLRILDEHGASAASVLRHRAARMGWATTRYLDWLDGDRSGAEMLAIAAELTVPETYFFRYPDQFRVFADVVLPQRMRARERPRTLHFLSAGCASGAEPYSLAIAAADEVPAELWRIHILGVDVNVAGLDQARSGQYSAWTLRATPERVRRRWFTDLGGRMVLDDRIRGAVWFQQRNLAAPNADLWTPERYDAIFCRNVLMYLTAEAGRQLVTRMTAALATGGYLFLGEAEHLGRRRDELVLREREGCFYYERIATASSDHPDPLCVAGGWDAP